MDSSRQTGTQSVQRAVTILRAVARHNNRGVRLTEVAREVQLNIATTRRLLSVLTTEGFITFDPVTKLYYLGPEIYSLGNTDQYSPIRNTYSLILERIAKETEDTVYLVIRTGYDMIAIDRVEGNFSIRIMFETGVRLPLGIGAGSLAILSALPDKELESVLSANKLRYPKYNEMSVVKVRNLVKLARELGYSINDGNFLKGVTGVSVSIYNSKKIAIGAITVASISERLNRDRCDVIAKLITSEILLIKPAKR